MFRAFWIRRRFLWSATVLLSAALLGCGGGSLPDRADPHKAVEALRTALETWKKGEPVEALAKRTPPIYFNDPKATEGVRLSSFELDDNHEFFGQSVRVTVKATLARDSGKSKQRQLNYLVDTSPVIVIVPD
ncbi:MAG: hypothetical protein L0Y72_02490 [Gemmataceae bacterium]|nr:hypothetical protein [Gemmataceae bacterium]MCI0737885.1 hypothetical protein [Gemmataceae bacterium]